MPAPDWMPTRFAEGVAVLAAVLGIALCAPSALHSQTFTVLHRFSGGTDGENPQAGLVRDSAGNLYGTTIGGGDIACGDGYGCGTVFKIDGNGSEAILHRFTGPPDGETPMAGLIMDGDGNLYGTTFIGGESNFGTVFKVDASGHETILYSFGRYPDGEWPSGGLVMDADGVIYGTTQEGGTGESCFGGCGTVFKLDKAGKETVLLSFEPPAMYPLASPVLDGIGNLYGTTGGNGYSDLGTVFKLDGPNRAITLYTFNDWAYGAAPNGGVIRDAEGNIYGMTFRGGDLNNCIYSQGYGCGVLYTVSPTGLETVLHAFAGPPDGALPFAGLLQEATGNLYGTTSRGGTAGYGTVFKMDKHGKMRILHNFAGPDGSTPDSTLVRDEAGNLYGTTLEGGVGTRAANLECGVVFKITP